MKAMGSLNCSSVGKKVGQLERPKGRVRDVLFNSLGLVVFTVFKSRAAETVIGVLSTDGGGTMRWTVCGFPSSIPKEGERERRLRAASASILDLRGARLESPPAAISTDEDDDASAVDAMASSDFSTGVVPSTAIEREEVKVAAALSAGFADTYG